MERETGLLVCPAAKDTDRRSMPQERTRPAHVLSARGPPGGRAAPSGRLPRRARPPLRGGRTPGKAGRAPAGLLAPGSAAGPAATALRRGAHAVVGGELRLLSPRPGRLGRGRRQRLSATGRQPARRWL